MPIATFLRRLAPLFLFFAGAALADAPVKVVYHFSEGHEQATRGLRNVGNHLAVDPAARIVVVALGPGIDFLVGDAKDKNGNAYAAAVDELTLKGVEFRVCNVTLTSRKIDPKRLHAEAKVVPSGVVEISKLQAKEGFAYIKP